MPTLNVFENDAFGVISLTTAINKLPYKPARLGEMGLFRKDGITTTQVMVEEKRGVLMLVPNVARGSGGMVDGGNKDRKARHFGITHLPVAAAVMADDVQNVRAFDTEDEVESASELVNDKLADLRQHLEFTHEWHRIAAIHGLLLDADGSEIYNWFDEFSITENTVQIDWTTYPRSATKRAATDACRIIEDALGMETHSGVHAMCGKDIFDNIVNSTEVRAAYDRWQESSFLRGQQMRSVFEYAGVKWEEYRGKLGSTPFIADNEIRLFPLGTRKIFEEIYGPADYMETVNTKGKPVYAKQERMKFDKGVELEAQSNPLIMCCRPSVLVKMTSTGTPEVEPEPEE